MRPDEDDIKHGQDADEYARMQTHRDCADELAAAALAHSEAEPPVRGHDFAHFEGKPKAARGDGELRRLREALEHLLVVVEAEQLAAKTDHYTSLYWSAVGRGGHAILLARAALAASSLLADIPEKGPKGK